MKKLILGFIVSLFSVVSYGQNTSNVNGIIVVNSSQDWVYATITGKLINPTGTPMVYKDGSGPVPHNIYMSTDAFANIDAGTYFIPRNDKIIPAGTYWDFVVCPASNAPCQDTNTKSTVTGATYDISFLGNLLKSSTVNSKSFNVNYSTSNILSPSQGDFAYLMNYTGLVSSEIYAGNQWISFTQPSNPIGPAGGDLSGIYPNPSVAKVNGLALPVSAPCTGTNSSGQVIPATCGGSPTGAAGGDLSGSYPNPSVAQVNGVPIPTSSSVLGSNSAGQLINQQNPSIQTVTSLSYLVKGLSVIPAFSNYSTAWSHYAFYSQFQSNGDSASNYGSYQFFCNLNTVAQLECLDVSNIGINIPSGSNYQIGGVNLKTPNNLAQGSFASPVVTVDSTGQVSSVTGINPSLGSTLVTLGTGVTSATCSSTNCTADNGLFNVVIGAGFTGGTIFTYNTGTNQTQVPVCVVNLGLGMSETINSITVSGSATLASSTIGVRYICAQ